MISPATRGSGAPRGTPIGTTRTSPACNAPGATWRPIFEPWKVPVTSARTASPSTSPVVAFTPHGTSQATTGASSALIAAIAEAIGSRGVPSKPVPSIASTIAALPSSSPGSNGSGGAPGSRVEVGLGVALQLAEVARGEHVDARSRSSRSSRATTSPSPPLLPLPTTIRIGPVADCATSAVTRARPSPARSIRSSDGTPCSSIAQASTARISARLVERDRASRAASRAAAGYAPSAVSASRSQSQRDSV